MSVPYVALNNFSHPNISCSFISLQFARASNVAVTSGLVFRLYILCQYCFINRLFPMMIETIFLVWICLAHSLVSPSSLHQILLSYLAWYFCYLNHLPRQLFKTYVPWVALDNFSHLNLTSSIISLPFACASNMSVTSCLVFILYKSIAKLLFKKTLHHII